MYFIFFSVVLVLGGLHRCFRFDVVCLSMVFLVVSCIVYCWLAAIG
jgi:hypothetical protein